MIRQPLVKKQLFTIPLPVDTGSGFFSQARVMPPRINHSQTILKRFLKKSPL